MKLQWGWLFAILFAIIIAIFSVANVAAVSLSYVFGVISVPLVLIILVAALLGALLSGTFAIIRTMTTKKQISHLQKEVHSKDLIIAQQKNELDILRKEMPLHPEKV